MSNYVLSLQHDPTDGIRVYLSGGAGAFNLSGIQVRLANPDYNTDTLPNDYVSFVVGTNIFNLANGITQSALTSYYGYKDDGGSGVGDISSGGNYFGIKLNDISGTIVDNNTPVLIGTISGTSTSEHAATFISEASMGNPGTLRYINEPFVSLENVVFQGDDVSFDVFFNQVPPGITSPERNSTWTSLVIDSNLNTADPGWATSTLTSANQSITVSKSGTGLLISTSDSNFTGKVASFTGKASIFGTNADDGDNSSWSNLDLLQTTDTTSFGIKNISVTGNKSETLTVSDVTRIFYDGFDRESFIGGTKPMVTFENLSESGGMLTFDVWLNEFPDRNSIATLEEIEISGVFGGGTPTWSQNSALTSTSGLVFTSDTTSLTIGSSSNPVADVLYAGGFTSGTGSDIKLSAPVKLGTISANSEVFGLNTDGTGGTATSGWEILDLGVGSSGYGINMVELLGYDTSYQPASPISIPIDNILNYSESGGGDTGTTEPVITYTHIGNAGGQSGIDDTETQYSDETTAVKFQIDRGMIVDNSSHITFTNFSSQNDWVYFDVVVESLPETNSVTWDYLSYITIYTGLQGFTAHNENAVQDDYIKVINSPDNWYIGYGDGTAIHFRSDSISSESQIGTSLGTIGMHQDYLITESGYFSGDGDTTFNTSDAHSFFTDWNGNTAHSNSLDLRGYKGSEYMEKYGFKWSASESGQGRLGVVDSSLYTDQGADGNTPTEMGVYLDLGMGLASTLLPSANTVSAPKAAIIQEETGTPPTWSIGDGTEDVTFTNYAYDSSTGMVSFDVNINTSGLRSIHWHKMNNSVYSNSSENQAKVTFEAAEGSPFGTDFRYTIFELSTYDNGSHDPTDFSGFIGRLTIDATLFPDYDPTSIGTFFGDFTPQVVTLYGGGSDVAFGAGDHGDQSYTTLHTFDGSMNLSVLEDELPWTVELSDRTDIFVGRDSVADSVSTTGYLPGIETIIATGGNDEIDGGGGYNVADFSQIKNAGYLDFDMASGEVSFIHNSQNTYQNWYGFQEVLGTDQNDNIYGTGEEDDELAEDMGSFDFGTNKIEFGAGSNVIEGNGGGDSIYGNGGNDFIFLGSSTDSSSIRTAVDGGEGDDLISLGLATDRVSGGGLKDVHSTMDGVNGDFVESDSYYNDAGVDLVYFKLADGDRPIDITQLSIQGETETVVIDVPTGLVTETTTWEEFVELANKQINIHFNNIDGTTGQLIADKAYKYMELQYGEYQEFAVSKTKVSGIELYLGEGFSTPSIQDTQVSYFYSDEEILDAPTWANVTFKGMVVGANGFARKNEFVDGTADDGDVFMAFTAANIDGDTIHDLDIGQNSLSLTGEVGEAIYFGSDFAGVQKITLQGYNSDGILIASDSTDPVSYYDAVITLSDATPNDTNDDVSFTLTDINGPTASLLTNGGTYKLAAVVNDANMVHTYHDDGLVGEVVNPAVAMKELTFEWQAKGEKVGSDASDKLNGSNANNLFRGNGENDFLNGSGGNDTYQFLGDFGNDKVFDSAGFDVLQIGANLDNVWFERLGRRGDELKVSVNDGTNVGSISIGRHFTPFSAAGFDYKVEEVHFGFNGIDFEEELTIYSGGQSILDHNFNSYDIVVSKNGEDNINLQADMNQGQNIYLNPNELATTVKLASRESDPSGMWMEFIGLELDYGSHKDHLKISIDNSQVAGSYDSEDVGALHSLLSKNSITVDTTSDFGINIIQSGDAYQFKDTASETLLFALEVNENIVI